MPFLGESPNCGGAKLALVGLSSKDPEGPLL
jgi:hypothetical protein